MKRLVSIILLCLTTSTFAANKLQGSYTLSLDALYWKLREGSADNWAQILPPAGTEQSAKVLGVPFPYHAGFRLGLRYTPKDKPWDIRFIFTDYQTTGRNSANDNVYSAFLGNFFAGNANGAGFGPYYDHGDIRWRFNYKTFDVRAGRHFIYDQKLDLHPFVGIKTALIDQNMYSNWDRPRSSATPPVTYNFTHATEDLQNDFVGIGPAIGVDTSWTFYQHNSQQLNLIGNTQAAIMWSYWRFKDVYQNNASSRIEIHNNNINSASTMIGALLGLEYQQSSKPASFKIRLAYEAEVWFSQMQFYSYNMGRLNNLMSLQGGSLSISTSF